MSDLCAPIYVVMEGDPELSFWCFVQVMERMVRCFHVYFYMNAPLILPLETEFFTRSKWYEETAVDTARTIIHNGSTTLFALGSVSQDMVHLLALTLAVCRKR